MGGCVGGGNGLSDDPEGLRVVGPNPVAEGATAANGEEPGAEGDCDGEGEPGEDGNEHGG